MIACLSAARSVMAVSIHMTVTTLINIYNEFNLKLYKIDEFHIQSHLRGCWIGEWICVCMYKINLSVYNKQDKLCEVARIRIWSPLVIRVLCTKWTHRREFIFVHLFIWFRFVSYRKLISNCIHFYRKHLFIQEIGTLYKIQILLRPTTSLGNIFNSVY
jgi:hypothetical protein